MKSLTKSKDLKCVVCRTVQGHKFTNCTSYSCICSCVQQLKSGNVRQPKWLAHISLKELKHVKHYA